jgi:hypothetical protein
MKERRRLERYSLQAAATIGPEKGDAQGTVFKTVTRDISSAGAFVVTSQPLAAGETIQMELLLPISMLSQIMGKSSNVLVSVKGKVVRTDSNGMAIAFDKRHSVSLIENGMGN